MEGIILGVFLSLFLLALCRNRPGYLIPWCRRGAMVSALILGLLVFFVVTHEGNRTGGDPWFAALVFVPAAALGGMVLRRDGFRRMALVAILIGLCGLGYLWYIDHTGTMVAYHRWIARGAP